MAKSHTQAAKDAVENILVSGHVTRAEETDSGNIRIDLSDDTLTTSELEALLAEFSTVSVIRSIAEFATGLTLFVKL